MRSSWDVPKQPTARSNNALLRSRQATFSFCINPSTVAIGLHPFADDQYRKEIHIHVCMFPFRNVVILNGIDLYMQKTINLLNLYNVVCEFKLL